MSLEYLTVHSPPLVCETLHLVSLPLAGLEERPEPHPDTSGSRRRSRLSRCYLLRLRSSTVRSRCDARRPGCQSRPLPWRFVAVIQTAGGRLRGLLRMCNLCPLNHVHWSNGSRKEEGTGGVRPARPTICRGLSGEGDFRKRQAFRGNSRK